MTNYVGRNILNGVIQNLAIHLNTCQQSSMKTDKPKRTLKLQEFKTTSSD